MGKISLHLNHHSTGITESVCLCSDGGLGRAGWCQQDPVNLMERPESRAWQLSNAPYQFIATFQLNLLRVSIGGTLWDRWVSWPFGSFLPSSTEHLLGVRYYAGNPQEYTRTRGMGIPGLPFWGQRLRMREHQSTQLLTLEKSLQNNPYIAFLPTTHCGTLIGELRRGN